MLVKTAKWVAELRHTCVGAFSQPSASSKPYRMLSLILRAKSTGS
jgi:hypothetical protein